ncbi:MAG TPA: PepSY domain-containing protein [Steroidobacteraceae bacterium]
MVRTAALVLALSSTMSSCGARAGSPPPPSSATVIAGTRSDHELSREQVVAQAQKRYGARVVRADTADQDGHHLYVLRLLSPAGKVWVVRVDARNGTEVP